MNIRKTLLEMDKATFNKYDLCHLYESCNLSDTDKQNVVDMLNKHEDAEVIYDNLKKYLSHDNIGDDIDSITEDYDSEYTKVSSKTVMDSNGFYTEYTWYRDKDGNNVFVFGDPDIYRPEDGDFDYETESNKVAVEWFDNYRGFEEDNDDLIEKCKSLKEDLPKEHLTIKLSGDTNVFVDERSITNVHEIRKAFLSEFDNIFINNNKQIQDKLMSEVIRVTERIIPEATLELETIDVINGYAVIDMEVGFVEDKDFEKLTKELSNIIFNWYEGEHLTMEFDVDECKIDYTDLDEDTVKTRKGKWVNKGKAGTHGTFATKKAADAQRKAMFASGWKGESLSESYIEEENDFIDRLWDILYDVSGIESIDYDADDNTQNIITFGSSDDLDKRLNDIEQAFKNTGVKYEEVATNGSNVIVIKVDKNTLQESLEGEDGWSEDIIEIADPFFVEVEKAAYELRNTVRGAYHFGTTVEELAELFRRFSEMADDIAETLDDEEETLTEASYGGAYDIADDEYFTKEDGMEAANEVISILEKEFPELKLEVADMQLDNHSLYVVLMDKDGNEFTEEVVIDMRKIRHPLDLVKKYAPALAELFVKEIREFHADLNESVKKVDLNKLETEIKDKVKEVMTSPEFGYDLEYVEDYSTVEVKRVDDRVKVEIRAEVTFEGLMELGQACNPIVEKYDKDAYFDPERPGITNAYLDI